MIKLIHPYPKVPSNKAKFEPFKTLLDRHRQTSRP
jgi:hypothetical protein